MRSRLVTPLLSLLLLAACGDDKLQNGDTAAPPDTADNDVDTVVPDTNVPETIVFDTFVPDTSEPDTTDTTQPDTAASCSDNPKPFFCPCDTNNQCESSYCIAVDEAEVARRCTRTCQDTCPNGWECKGTSGAGDPVFICQPPVNTLCEPCEQDADCQTVGALCIEFEDGKYCGRDCEGRETSCPSGYRCGEVLNEVGQIDGYQCVRTSGSCNCPDGTDYTTDPANCGYCGNACNYAGGVPGCRNEVCYLKDCTDDWKNLNQVEADGCEYRCTFKQDDDWPDASCDAVNNCDQNCDGIDGDWDRAVFVNASVASSGQGTPYDPIKTIGEGLAKAVELGRDHVYVAAGTYNESVTLKKGISVFGGYSSDGKWVRNLAQHKTTITWSAGTNSVRVVIADGIDARTVLDGVEVVAGTNANPGGSSYAIWVRNSNETLELANVSAVGGQGAPGAPGSPGQPGSDGVKGGDSTEAPDSDDACNDESLYGSQGGPAGSNQCSRGTSAAGGGGGASGCVDDSLLDNKHIAARKGGDSPGGASGGIAPGEGANGNKGSDGSNGGAGSNGSGGSSAGTIDSNGFWRGDVGRDGSDGTNGVGGGGGSGGGGTCCAGPLNNQGQWGGGGGGGGSGGCGGSRGTGGGGAGGSFGLFLFDSSPRLSASQFGHKSGGNGGAGGLGGAPGGGKSGGVGHDGFDGAGRGGSGGAGGNGGRGGHGGGGAGGVAFGIFLAGSSDPTCVNLSYSPPGSGGSGGLGGIGGDASGNKGADGDFGDKNKASSRCP